MVEMEQLCANPTCNNPGKHLCSGCGGESYCSKECQKAHWPIHKSTCKASVKPEAAAFLKDFDMLTPKQLKNILKAKAATYESKKKSTVLAKLENVVEKPALIKLVKEHVNASEIELLLSNPAGSLKDQYDQANTAANQQAKGASNARVKKQTTFAPEVASKLATPSPDQLRQQASMMRKNPGLVRKANAAFAHLSDEQIRQYADQLESAASDPNMMKEVEKMSKLNDSDRNSLQNIQEGLTGVRKVDDAWITSIIKTLKQKPDLFRTLFKGKGAMVGGITDDQIDYYIDMGSKMDEFTLKCIAYTIWYISSASKPLSEAYTTLDNYTFGSAKYIVLALFAFVAYYFSIALFFVLKWVFLQLYSLFIIISSALGVKAASPVENIAQKVASDLGSVAAKGAADVANAAGVAGLAATGAAAALNQAGAANIAANGANAAQQDDGFEF